MNLRDCIDLLAAIEAVLPPPAHAHHALFAENGKLGLQLNLSSDCCTQLRSRCYVLRFEEADFQKTPIALIAEVTGHIKTLIEKTPPPLEEGRPEY